MEKKVVHRGDRTGIFRCTGEPRKGDGRCDHGLTMGQVRVKSNGEGVARCSGGGGGCGMGRWKWWFCKRRNEEGEKMGYKVAKMA